MTNYAVLIGNSEFPDEPSLKPLICPPHDVDGLKTVLTAENLGQFLAENITVLVNQTSDSVRAAINRILKNATKDDLILLYYSGHGKTDNTGNDLYLTTLNTTDELLESSAVSFEQIYSWINRFYCKKFIIILDCCYSGTAGKVFRSDIAEQLQSLNNAATGTFLITSTTNDKVAVDKTEGSRFSLFTKHLIKGLETGEADKDGDGHISIDELFRYVSKKVTDENPNQKPKRFVKNETGEMIVGKSGKDSRQEHAEKIRLRLLDLEKQDEAIAEIKTEALAIARMEAAKLSTQQFAKDGLLTDLLAEKLTLVAFARQWEKLSHVEKQPEVKPEPIKPTPEPAKVKPASKPDFTKPEVEKSPVKAWKKYTLIVSCFAVVLIVLVPLVKTAMDKAEEHSTTDATETPATPAPSVSEPEMVSIKGGCFQMGSPESEPLRMDNEKQHQVCVGNFQIGKYEITQAQWQAVMRDNPSKFKGDNLPVEGVTRWDVQKFIEKLNAQTGKTYRLPTEAEWEYAARAGTTTPYYTGETITNSQANFNNLIGKTTAVGSYPANSWGLYDMAGNVWEWTCSSPSKNYDGSEMGCGTGSAHVVRGGSWNDFGKYVRSAYRRTAGPGVDFSYVYDTGYRDLGFRLVLAR